MVRASSRGLRCPLGFSSFPGGAVLVLVTSEAVAVVLVLPDGVVGPRRVAVVLALEVTAIKKGDLVSSFGSFVWFCNYYC